MNPKHFLPYRNAAGWILLALAPLLVWGVSNPFRQVVIEPTRFLFWHTAVETFAVVVAMLIFVTGYRAISSSRNGAVVLLGVAFLGVGLFDFLHAMSYAGMPDAVTSNSPQKSIFFWLAARILAASALMVYAFFPLVRYPTPAIKRLAVVLMLAFVGVLGCVGLFRPDAVPALFIPGQGLSALKVALEYLVIVINLVTLAALWGVRNEFSKECVVALAFTVALSAISEVFFTRLGAIDKDAANVFGHLYKVSAYLYLFHATFNEALRRPVQRMKTQHLREQVMLNAAPSGVLWVNSSGCILMANAAMETLTGYSPNELVGQNVEIFLPAHLRADHAQLMRSRFTSPRNRPINMSDLKLCRRDGRMLPVDISLASFEDGVSSHTIAYLTDLTERKEYEDSLRHKATHDELTGLPNRWLFRLQLDASLAHAGRSGLRVAVLLLDLDYFKTVNDSFGHPAGDALLVQVSSRIRAALRENDMLARLGGDEFGIFLTNISDVDGAICLANKVLAVLQSSFRLQNQDVYSGGSLGIAFYPNDASDSDTLLRYADMAMYQAKHASRGGYACYSHEMDRRAHEAMQFHTRLNEAITEGLLKLHYQPQVDVKTGAIVGVEALLRWHDPLLGDVSPARFIPVAEATGLIVPLSDWVLETACKQIAAWTRAGTPLCVSVNFSGQQFRQHNLHEKVASVLKRTNAEASWLCIEITESIAMIHPEQARAHLTDLVAMGCSVALDDFGTGYSSLAYLKTLPVSKLKIDKSFMDGIPHDASDVTISRAIIALAHNLGMTLVAEGVENDTQLAFLRQYDCELYQGWLYAKAMSAEDLTARFLSNPLNVLMT
ncbi:MAG: bifunctional diguanylate cyclase/phosphodiesterase [Telluria sp.]